MKQNLGKKKEGYQKRKEKEVGMKIGRSAVAALIQPPSLSPSVCGRVANGKHFCHSGDRGMYRNKRWKDRRRNEVEWEMGDLIDEWEMEIGCMCQL